jgi:hypothetical protein
MTIIAFCALIPTFLFAIILSATAGFDVSIYQPPQANLERHTKLLANIAIATPILSGVAIIVILAFRIPVDEPCRFYDLAMCLIVGTIAGFFIGVGADLLVVRSDLDSLIQPYRHLWLPEITIRAEEIQEDFECCGFDITARPEDEWSCYRSLPFCRDAIPDEYDRDELGLAVTALVFGVIDAILAIVWGVSAYRTLVGDDYRVGAQITPDPEPTPTRQREETYPAPGGYPEPYPEAQPSPLVSEDAPLYPPPDEENPPPEDGQP